MPFDITKTQSGWQLTPRLATDYDDRLVAFVDILGFTDLVRRSTNDRQARNLLRNLQLTFEVECLGEPAGNALPLTYSHGSDSVVISCPAERQIAHVMLMRLQLLQGHMLSMYGVLCRGGLAAGPLIHAANVFYGPAYLDAHGLENRAAMPMIAVSEPLMGQLAAWPECSALIRRDTRSGMAFVDYLWSTPEGQGLQTSGFARHRAQIVRLLESSERADERIQAKHDWLVNYFNEAVARVPALGVPVIERQGQGP